MNETTVEEVQTERVGRGANGANALVATSEARGGHLTSGAAVYALGTMSDDEFEARLRVMKISRERAQRIQREMMTSGVHFSKPPGRENDANAKDGLLKPGSELLQGLHNFVPDFKHEITYGDPKNTTSPAVSILTRCEMHLGSVDGPIVGIGYGAASSWEVKYRYRNAARECPSCHKTTIMRSKFDAKGGPFKGQRPWWCNDKNGGCGSEFAPDDPKIKDQVVGRVPNEDAVDLLNTLVKMSEKRADMGTTIRATHSSDLFTQDIEDLGTGSQEDGEKSFDEATMTMTEAQATTIRHLAEQKLGTGTDESIAVYLNANGVKGWPGEVSFTGAARGIEKLRSLSDAKKAATSTSSGGGGNGGAKKAPTATEVATSETYRRRILELDTERMGRGAVSIFDKRTIPWTVIDGGALKAAGRKSSVAFDELTVDELHAIGMWMHNAAKAAA